MATKTLALGSLQDQPTRSPGTSWLTSSPEASSRTCRECRSAKVTVSKYSLNLWPALTSHNLVSVALWRMLVTCLSSSAVTQQRRFARSALCTLSRTKSPGRNIIGTLNPNKLTSKEGKRTRQSTTTTSFIYLVDVSISTEKNVCVNVRIKFWSSMLNDVNFYKLNVAVFL